jgi:hypothetical protein
MPKTDPLERLREAIDAIKSAGDCTNEDISTALGYRGKNYLSEILGKSKGMNDIFLDKFQAKYGYSKEWIKTGAGDKIVENATRGTSLQEPEAVYHPQQPAEKTKEKPDLLAIIAESFQHQKEIDLLREQNRAKEVSTREKEADNTARLIALLEQQQATGLQNVPEEVSFLKKNDVIHFGHHSSLRQFVLEFAAQIRKTDYKTQQLALRKLEGEALRASAGKDKLVSESEGSKDSRKKTEKAHLGSSDGS